MEKQNHRNSAEDSHQNNEVTVKSRSKSTNRYTNPIPISSLNRSKYLNKIKEFNENILRKSKNQRSQIFDLKRMEEGRIINKVLSNPAFRTYSHSPPRVKKVKLNSNFLSQKIEKEKEIRKREARGIESKWHTDSHGHAVGSTYRTSSMGKCKKIDIGANNLVLLK